MSDGVVYSWDQPVVENPNESGEYVLLEPGEYPFQVVRFERGQFPGGGKTPPCPKAFIYIEVDGGGQGKVEVKDDLIMHSNFDWKLCAFFKSIGDRKHGEPLRMDWQRVPGKTGVCKIKHRSGKGQNADKKYNEVDKYLDPSVKPAAAPPPVAQTAAVDDGFDWDSGKQSSGW